MSEVLFLVDHSAGKITKAAGELATYAKSIGDSVAVVFADNAQPIVDQLNAFPVDKVITIAGEFDKYGPAAIADFCRLENLQRY
jgi:electron transfer flavoprotein alpha subunit